MSNYMIHTCPKRKWYVDKYLIPSMLEQGIKFEDITIYSDDKKDGHLVAFLKSCEQLSGSGTWHLQDDIIISSLFRTQTEAYDDGVVCGFCNNYSKYKDSGYVSVSKMWYSMPCIRIPDFMMRGFLDWFKQDAIQERFRHCIIANKHSDVLIDAYLKEEYPDLMVLHLKPNIINHIDHLIGGSIINKGRSQDTEYIMSVYWKEPKLIKELEEKLNGKA